MLCKAGKTNLQETDAYDGLQQVTLVVLIISYVEELVTWNMLDKSTG